jgi:hypothetical protein
MNQKPGKRIPLPRFFQAGLRAFFTASGCSFLRGIAKALFFYYIECSISNIVGGAANGAAHHHA